jgi:hypothetical protein
MWKSGKRERKNHLSIFILELRKAGMEKPFHSGEPVPEFHIQSGLQNGNLQNTIHL